MAEILNNNDELPTFQPNKKINDKMELLHIKEKQVKNILEKLKISKSPGPDGLHPTFLKELAPELCKPLALIFN